MSLLDDMMNWIRYRAGQNQTWPPAAVSDHWGRVSGYRRRFVNDRDLMLQYTPEFNRTDEGKEIYTPVPVAASIARMSSALLFSEPPKITMPESAESKQQDLDAIIKANGLDAFLAATAENVAIEGRGGLRVIFDTEISDEPLLTHVSEDQVIWDVRHGRFVTGGLVVIEHRKPLSIGSVEVWRLLERHERGKITRELYKGTDTTLGTKEPLTASERFEMFRDEESTNLDTPTLVPWLNTPSGKSDIAGLDALLDSVNEGESLLLDKGRKSIPIVFADPSVAEENGDVNLKGVVFARSTPGSNITPELGSALPKVAEVVQPGLHSEEHIAWIEHTVNVALEMAGYSRASWGRDQGGSADSGKALRLRQSLTLLTRAGKERMAREAISQALAVALASKNGGKVEDLRPDIQFSDGMPDDPLETAQEVAVLASSGAASLASRVKKLRPDLDEKGIEDEVREIRGEAASEPRSASSDTNQ